MRKKNEEPKKYQMVLNGEMIGYVLEVDKEDDNIIYVEIEYEEASVRLRLRRYDLQKLVKAFCQFVNCKRILCRG